MDHLDEIMIVATKLSDAELDKALAFAKDLSFRGGLTCIDHTTRLPATDSR